MSHKPNTPCEAGACQYCENEGCKCKCHESAAPAPKGEPVPFPQVSSEVAEQLRHYIGNSVYALETAINMHDSDSLREYTDEPIERIKKILHDLGTNDRAPSAPPSQPSMTLSLVSETIHSMDLHRLIMKRLQEIGATGRTAPAPEPTYRCTNCGTEYVRETECGDYRCRNLTPRPIAKLVAEAPAGEAGTHGLLCGAQQVGNFAITCELIRGHKGSHMRTVEFPAAGVPVTGELTKEKTMNTDDKLSRAMDLLGRAAEYLEGKAPDKDWFRDYFLLTGQRMILTEEGWQSAESKNALVEEYGPDVIMEEVNVPEPKYY